MWSAVIASAYSAYALSEQQAEHGGFRPKRQQTYQEWLRENNITPSNPKAVVREAGIGMLLMGLLLVSVFLKLNGY